MKTARGGVLLLGIAILGVFFACGNGISEGPENALEMSAFLPGDDEIPGWTRSEKNLGASTEEELYRIFNGGAGLYIQHGCQAFVGQSYRGPRGVELEVHIFDQRTAQNAHDLYDDPFLKPVDSEDIADLGARARLDMSSLFCYELDFIEKGFFVRVVIQDRTDEGLNRVKGFARVISGRIR